MGEKIIEASEGRRILVRAPDRKWLESVKKLTGLTHSQLLSEIFKFARLHGIEKRLPHRSVINK